jgi:antitoxin component of RelBE/YafQ-DinJ toxin-antitoxin module
MVDRFSKYVVFVVMKMPCSVEEVVKLFFKHIVKYWGLPLNIVSDRDARFTSKFWTTLFKLVGMKLLKSSSYHPQTDGKTE